MTDTAVDTRAYPTGWPLLLLTVAVSVATFMEVLDTAIANVAVPTIAGNLAVGASQGTWVISSYGLAAAIAVPLTGWIARRFGEVRVFVVSVFLFSLASALCGLAQSLPQLVLFRFLQGLVSGPMVPLSQTLLLSIYPPARRGIALALWSMTVVVAPIAGPLLGGYITDNLTWPWIFYINVPIGFLAGWVSARMLRGRETATMKLPVDYVGLGLLILGVGSLQLMLDNGNDLDWFNSHVIMTLAVVAVVSLSFFIVWELTEEHPIVDLSLLARRNFSAGVVALSLGFMTFFAMNVMFPLWLQTVMGYTAAWAGVATAPVGIFALILSPLVGRYLARIDLRWVASMAFIVFALTMHWLSTFNLQTPFALMFLPRLLQGIGVACFFIPINSIIISGLPMQRLAAAAGLSNFFRTLSGSFGTALVVMIWDDRARQHRLRLSEWMDAQRGAVRHYTHTLGHLGVPHQGVWAASFNMLDQQSFMIATAEIFHTASWIFLSLIVLVWLAKPPFSAGAGGGH